RVGPPALPAHPHDGLRVHPGCGAADARERGRLRRAERHGDCGVLWHAGRDVPWCLHHPRQLRLRGAARPLPTAVEASSGRAGGSDTARRASVSRTARGDEVGRPPDLEAVPSSLTWDLTRILLAVVGIGGLIAASVWVLRPFLPAVVWGTMIVVATWPTVRAVEARLWGGGGLGGAVVTAVAVAGLGGRVAVGAGRSSDRAEG